MTLIKIAIVVGSIISAYFYTYYTSIDIPKPEDIMNLFLWLAVTIFMITVTSVFMGNQFLFFISIIFIITFIICRIFFRKINRKQ